MYNLLVSGNPEAWDGSPWDVEMSRVLRDQEYTAAPLSQKYGSLNDAAVEALLGFPTLLAYETSNKQPARIGHITRIRLRGNTVRVEYAIDASLPPIAQERLLALQWDLDVTDWEMNRTHWALKDADLLSVLIEAGEVDPATLRRQPPGSPLAAAALQEGADISARPRVFKIPAAAPDANLVYVMMPFAQAFNPVYEAIQRACTATRLQCDRADNVWQESEVIQDIFSLIYRSKIVICDFSNQNPNVFYEAGVAHTLGRHVVPIAQNANDIPFDLRHHRYIQYLNNAEGMTELSNRLGPRLRTLRDLP
jgi:hypothetical protein